jgi:hypothetical protein
MQKYPACTGSKRALTIGSHGYGEQNGHSRRGQLDSDADQRSRVRGWSGCPPENKADVLHRLVDVRQEGKVFGDIDLRCRPADSSSSADPPAAAKPLSSCPSLDGCRSRQGRAASAILISANRPAPFADRSRSDTSAGLTDLEDDFTVAQHVAERQIMLQPWYKPWVSKSSLREVIGLFRDTFTTATELIDDLPPRDVLDDRCPACGLPHRRRRRGVRL